MKVTLYSHSNGADRVVGTVTLTPAGKVEMDEPAHRRLDELRVFDERGEVTPADGRRYLLALPTAWRGSYIWTTTE